jgi:hypothetical protein
VRHRGPRIGFLIASRHRAYILSAVRVPENLTPTFPEILAP